MFASSRIQMLVKLESLNLGSHLNLSKCKYDDENDEYDDN